jgi:ribose/xylose/arabinose/galactoside ABC-type transport system permease subunit
MLGNAGNGMSFVDEVRHTVSRMREKTAIPSIGALSRETVTPLLLMAVLVVLGLFFSVKNPAFYSLTNIGIISGQTGILLLAALGATFVVLMGSIDLSIGSISLVSGAVTALLIANHGMGLAALPIAVLVGAACGLVNGVIFVVTKIPSFIVTLGMLTVLQGVADYLLSGTAISFNDDTFALLANGNLIPHIPNVALWGLGAWVIMAAIGLFTRFGRHMYAIGGGESVARLAGIAVTRQKVYAFMLSGATAGLAGVLVVAELSTAGPDIGSTTLLNAIAAIVVSGTALSGGVGGVQRTLLGALLIAMLNNGLNVIDVNPFLQLIIVGLVVIVAVVASIRRSEGMIAK